MDVSMYFDVNSGLPFTFVLSNKIFSVLVHFSPNSLGVLKKLKIPGLGKRWKPSIVLLFLSVN
jgi:hypothetical protein